MADKKIWAFFLQLSNHMWDDEDCELPVGWYLPPTRFEAENKTDLAVWDRTVQFIAQRGYNMLVIDVGDGIRYDSHPEISAPDAWSKEFLKKKLDELRALGIEPIPKLNFSAGHHTWLKGYNRMVSTPAYYQVCADLIAEVCEAFGRPRLFHLGLDEETCEHQKRQAHAIVRGEKLWWHDCHFLFEQCEKNGARPWVWSDCYWYNSEAFIRNMPKSVLQSNWYYDNFKVYPEGDLNNKAISTYEELDRLGYDQIPGCSLWMHTFNAEQTVAYAKDRLSDDLLKGFLIIPWTWTFESEEYTLQDNAHRLWLARKKYYPETL